MKNQSREIHPLESQSGEHAEPSTQPTSSLTFRFLKKFGFDYSEAEHGQTTFFQLLGKVFWNFWDKQLEKMMDWPLLEPILPRKLRPKILKWRGCKIGKHVFVGDYVRVDGGHCHLIEIDDYAHVTSGCRLLCHQRDLRNYRFGDNAADLGYRTGKIHIGKGCMIGMETMIMPGVTIGDGAIVGARSLVTKDIPPYTIATGMPAKVLKTIPPREESRAGTAIPGEHP